MLLTKFIATLTRGWIFLFICTPAVSVLLLPTVLKTERDGIYFLNTKCPLPIILNYSPGSSLHFSGQPVPFIMKENVGTGLKNVCCGDSWQITAHGTQFPNPRYHQLKDKQSCSTSLCPCTSIPRWPCSSKQKVDLNLVMTSVLSHRLSDKKESCWIASCLNPPVPPQPAPHPTAHLPAQSSPPSPPVCVCVVLAPLGYKQASSQHGED